MSDRLVIRGATIVDGTGAEPIRDGVILVEGERIVQVSQRRELGDAIRIGPETRVVEADGTWLIPGMINLHEHLDNHRGVGSFQTRATQPPEWLIMRSFRNALISLAMGVTTVRDVHSKRGTNIVVRDAINIGQALGPRVFACGQAIAMTAGHGSEIVREADGPDDVRRATREQLKAGADLIKVMASGGHIAQGKDHPWSPQLSVEELRAATEEASRAGKTVAAHAHPPVAIRNAIEAGVTTIEHGALMDRETAELIEKSGVWLVPTLDESFMIAEYGHELGRPQWLIDACRAKLEHRLEAFSYAVDGGVKCGVGTDVAGEMGREMSHMIDAGMRPMEALVSATRHGAEILGVQDELGTLQVGKLADMVILDDDPLGDVLACDRPRLVIKGGVVHEPAQLRAALGPKPS